MRLTLSPNPTAAYHTNHPERGGVGKPEVDFSTRTPVYGMGLLLATLWEQNGTNSDKTGHRDIQGCPQR